jgi:class 3 adenylate cyclase/tetratricopeptide (TPR) repeat protein/ABC-type dipeptide/oligopeptide/nickel transport system ATPase component
MKCPNCHSANEETQKFCRVCGARLQMACPGCGSAVLLSDKFCGECRLELQIQERFPEVREKVVSERKHITALFADVSGYTTLAERLDPEEVADLTRHLFGEIAKVVFKYEGFIDKFAGDAVMVLFGIPKSHEDDPIRAVRAAIEIHRVVGEISPKAQERIGRPLFVHIGINTGLVVTGESHLEKAAHHVAGDTVNVASRLCSLAQAGETLVGQITYAQVEGFFAFEPLGPVMVKGKTKPVPVYKFLSPRKVPSKTHRLSGLRADLIGRKKEMGRLTGAVDKLLKGQGSVISICGEAGSGKSRLVEEFKDILDLGAINWIEGHAYAYSQNISYFPLIDLMNRELGIKESDSPEKVGEKLEIRLKELGDLKEDVVPYLGGLLSLNYPELADVSPDFWKSRLHQAIQATLSALSKEAPTIICLEDLHWADPSFLEFLRLTLSEQQHAAIFLCVFRLPFNLFSRQEIVAMKESYQEIQVQDLSSPEVQEMVESILKTVAIPEELRKFIQEKVGGNPFYLEEMINSLIQSGTLTSDNGRWQLARAINESDIPSTIHAVVSGRIDRLPETAKQLLQEASVIGRTVPYEILKRTTEHADSLDTSLTELELLDLLRRSLQSEQEYVFKHALIQEVVYSGLLKKDRQMMHQRVGLVMEQVFYDRLPEFYETLAFHFKQSESSHKAVAYLLESGRKSLRKYAVKESNQFYCEAFTILRGVLDDSSQGKSRLLDFLNEWGLIFYYRADFKGFTKLFLQYKELAESIDDKARLAMFLGWLGFAMIGHGKMKESYEYSSKALKLGEEIKNYPIIGLACCNLTWSCAELKLLDEGIQYGTRAEAIAEIYNLEPMVFFQSLAGMGMIYWFQGNSRGCLEIGRRLEGYGQRHSNLRSIVVAHICSGYGYYLAGNFPRAIECCKKAIALLKDPLFSEWSKLFLSMNFLINNQLQEAEDLLSEVIESSKTVGLVYTETGAQALFGAVLVARGRISQGLKMLEDGRQQFLENGRLFSLYILEFTLGEIYFQIATRARTLGFVDLVKNLGFIIKGLPFAGRNAESYLNKTIQVGREVGMQGILQGQAYLDLGLLHKLNGRKEQSRACLGEALQILEQCESEIFLQRAQEALASLG